MVLSRPLKLQVKSRKSYYPFMREPGRAWRACECVKVQYKPSTMSTIPSEKTCGILHRTNATCTLTIFATPPRAPILLHTFFNDLVLGAPSTPAFTDLRRGKLVPQHGCKRHGEGKWRATTSAYCCAHRESASEMPTNIDD